MSAQFKTVQLSPVQAVRVTTSALAAKFGWANADRVGVERAAEIALRESTENHADSVAPIVEAVGIGIANYDPYCDLDEFRRVSERERFIRGMLQEARS